MKKFKNCYTNKSKVTHVNLSKPFMFLINILYYTGLSPFYKIKHTTDRYQQLWHLKWSYLNILIFSIVHFLILYYHHELFYIGDNFGKLNDFIKVSTVGVSHIVCLLETIITRKSFCDFYRIYSQLHGKWSNYRDTRREFKIYKKFFLLLLVYLVIVIMVEINYMFEIHHKKQWISFFIAYMPSVTICRFRMLQIAMYLYMIMMETLQLNKEILLLVDCTKNQQDNFKDDIISIELSRFMQIYQDIYTLMELVKKSCSISILVVFIKSYVKILSDIYWTYWVIYNKDDIYGKNFKKILCPTHPDERTWLNRFRKYF